MEALSPGLYQSPTERLVNTEVDIQDLTFGHSHVLKPSRGKD